LLLARIIDGALGSNMTISQAYISDITKPEHRTRVFGYTSGVFGGALIFGPFIGGVLSGINFSVPMFLAAGITFVSIVLVVFFLPETIAKKPDMISLRFDDILPIKETIQFAKIRQARNRLLMFFVYNLGFFLLISNFALFVESQFNVDASQAGLYLAWLGLIRVVVQTFFIARILRSISEWNMLRTGIIAIIISMVGFAFSQEYLFVFVPLLFLSYGSGVIRPVLMSKLTNSATKNQTATILGVNNSLTSIAQIITPIAGGFIIQYMSPQIIPTISILVFLILLGISQIKD